MPATIFDIKADSSGSHNGFIAATAATRRGPCFAYFYATWCPDCTRSTPLIEKAFRALPPGGATLIMVDIGDKGSSPYTGQGVYRDKEGALRRSLAPYDLQCLPTLMHLGNETRIDKALESEQDPAKGQELVDQYMAGRPAQPGEKGVAQLGLGLIGGLALAALIVSMARK